MRILFLGTPEFAVPSLDALLGGPDPVVGVVSQPDRPRGRGRQTEATPVAARARARGLPVLQPEKLHAAGALDSFRALAPDLLVTCAFGRLLKKRLLELPPMGCLNVHASLLPRHRGASPIARAILEGDAWTGVTIFRLDEGMDTGPILVQRTERILPDDTAGALGERLARLGAAALLDACAALREGRANAIPQADNLATHAPMLRKEDGEIDWSRPADQVERFVRAMTPWPGARVSIAGHVLRVGRAEPVDVVPRACEPGAVLAVDPFPVVATLPGALRLLRVQPAGRSEMGADAWARGARLSAG